MSVLNIADFMSKCSPCASVISKKSNNNRPYSRLELLTNHQLQHPTLNSMKTHYIKLQGAFHLKLLQSCLDSLLYNNKSSSNHSNNNGNYNEDVNTNTSHNEVESAIISSSSTSTNKVLVSDMKIFRMKGIVYIHQCNNLYILQAVHEIFDLQESSYDVGSAGDVTDGNNLIVIIGKNLDYDLIEEKIMSCIA